MQVPRLSAEQLTLKRGPAIKQLDENEPSLDKEVVDKYLASLRSAVDSKSEVSEVSCQPEQQQHQQQYQFTQQQQQQQQQQQ
eukprot:1153412-Pelagomonas_calceolata.AAC.4